MDWQKALSDYSQLLEGYPNAKRFAQALRGNIEQNVPSQADFESPEAMSQWSQSAALNAPMGLVFGGTKKAPLVMQSIEDYVGHHTAPTKEFGAPLHDVTGGGEFYPEDIYSNMGYHYYGEGRGMQDKMLFSKIKALRNKPEQEVEIYRAVPNDPSITSINHGDWITIDPLYAKEHGQGPLKNDYKILKAKVPAKAVFTNADSPYEYGLDLSVLENELGLTKKTAHELAHDIAQKNAVEMLGLSENNTAMDRAKALGFNTPAYHTSRTGVDTNVLDSGKYAISPFDAIGTHFGTKEAALDRFNRTVGTTEQIKGSSYPVLLKSDKPYFTENDLPYTEDQLSMILSSNSDYGNLPKSNVALREKIFKDYSIIPYINDVEAPGTISYIAPPQNIRSRFAAFDPAKIESSDILASLAPLAVLGYANKKDEDKQRYIDLLRGNQ